MTITLADEILINILEYAFDLPKNEHNSLVDLLNKKDIHDKMMNNFLYQNSFYHSNYFERRIVAYNETIELIDIFKYVSNINYL